MSADDELRAAHERAVERERIRLLPLFAPPVASALERYFSETVGRGMPTDAARRALAETLAPYGIADPDGIGRLPRPMPILGLAARGPAFAHLAELQEEHRRSLLSQAGVTLESFQAEVARRNRESVSPVTPREVAEAMRRNPPPRPPSWPLRLRKALARLVAPSDPENSSQ